MRNIFDQYTQPENRLTHSLASALHQDRSLLKSFLDIFGPTQTPGIKRLKVIEQSLPGKSDLDERESRGLPDALIYNDEGWALVVESKVSDNLTRNQLHRHRRTIERCGFEEVYGLAITVREPGFQLDGWKMVSWRDVYAWASKCRSGSKWAGVLVDYFNVAEARMTNDQYLKEGAITEFSGISFDPYTYLESKRVLRLLTQKLRSNKTFINEMGLDPESGRSAITEQQRLWDFISFRHPEGKEVAFQKFPHCTIGIGPSDAEAMISFPNAMRAPLFNKLRGDSLDDFTARLQRANQKLIKSLKGTGLTGQWSVLCSGDIRRSELSP